MSALTEVVDQLLIEFPDFRPRWSEAVGNPEDERLPYVEIGEFARFVIDTFDSGDEVGTTRMFGQVDQLFASGDNEVQTLMTIGFLEEFQNFAMQRKHPLEAFTRFLSPNLLQEWNALKGFWSGEIKFIPSR